MRRRRRNKFENAEHSVVPGMFCLLEKTSLTAQTS